MLLLMIPWVDPRVTVYAPLGPDLLDYLNRISLFNSRPENPTTWALDIHTGSDPMAEMLRGQTGNIVVFTGRNRGKIDRILAALKAGLNVLADKPWIIASADLPKLQEALALAQRKNLAAYDIMTERYEVTRSEGGPQRARRQTVDHRIGRSAEAPRGAGAGPTQEPGGVRHHDRALRGHQPIAARVRQRPRGIRRPRNGPPGGTGRPRAQHPSCHEGGGRNSPAASLVVLRYRRIR